jgi:1,2-diacylglycerol 3-alpha-glucosyltransferase
LKILNVSDVYFPRINGVSTSIRTFQLELEKLGHSCHLIAPAYGPRGEEPGITRLPSWRVPFDPEDRVFTRGSLLGLQGWVERQGFDVVHVQTPFNAHRAGVELARRLGLPVVATYHTFFEEYLHHYIPLAPRRFTRAMARTWSRRQCNEVDAVVVPSRAMEETLRAYGVVAPMERLPTGLRLDEFKGGDGAAFRERYRIAADRPTLVHIGRVAFEKNIDFLLRMLREVVAAVPDILLVIAGEGPALPALRRQVFDLHLQDHVLFVGYLDRGGDLLDCYRAADAFVFASRTETQGLVLLEAMALSVPVVSTACQGTIDILDPGLGCLVAEENEKAFAQQVVRLLQQPELRCRLRREASDYVARHWEAAVMARRLAALYHRLLSDRRAIRKAA